MKLTIIGYAVQKVSQRFDVQGVVEMPIGANPFAVSAQGDSLVIMALANPEAVTVDHPLYIFPLGGIMEMPLGARPGSFIGHTVFGDNMAFVFRGEGWPESGLAIVETRGRG